VDLKEMEILGDQVDTHWYYRAKSAALLRGLRSRPPREVLDIGAGSGFFSRVLLANTDTARATCVDIGYDGDRDEMHAGKRLAFRRAIDRSDADLVLLMDVLEHVDDEVALLRPYVDAVAPGTRFVVTVPAFRFLWSGHDVFLEHRRRYTLASLLAAVRPAGLVPDRCHYYYGAVFPLAAGVRLLQRVTASASAEPRSQLRREARLANAVLGALCAVERPFMRANRLAGLSVFAEFRKP
jgi:SAM-dependent methyltransferase